MVKKIINNDSFYQTPPEVVKYMVNLIPDKCTTVLEPTPGDGNIVKELGDYLITAPEDFFKLPKQYFDCIIMNPPFSAKYAYNVPDSINVKGMKLGYHILTECMQMSNNIIALMPWFTLSNSDVRLRFLKSFGLKSITALPRKTFNYVRIQTCIIELEKGYKDDTKFFVFNFNK